MYYTVWLTFMVDQT